MKRIKMCIYKMSFNRYNIVLLSFVCALSFLSNSAYSRPPGKDDYQFCFAVKGTSTCEPDKDGDDRIQKETVELSSIGQDLTVDNINFKFRAFTKKKPKKDDKWNLWPHDVMKCSDYSYDCDRNGTTISENDFSITMSSPEALNHWPVDEDVYGKVSDDENQYTDVSISMTFKKEWLGKLQTGDHIVLLKIHGAATEGKGMKEKHHEDIYIFITLKAPTLAKLSSVEDVNFGSFLSSNYNPTQYQHICVFVQGGGIFKIWATSEQGKSTSQYLLAGVNNPNVTVPYFIGIDYRGGRVYNLLHGRYFRMRGSSSENCNGTDNIMFGVFLDELQHFSDLSRLPSDTYRDRLTITVEAE